MVRVLLCDFGGGAAASRVCAPAANSCCSNVIGVLDDHGGQREFSKFRLARRICDVCRRGWLGDRGQSGDGRGR